MRRSPSRSVVFAIGLLLGGCVMATLSVSTPEDVKALTGMWRGWIVTGRDFTPATLEIHSDAVFEISGFRVGVVRGVTGTLAVRDGNLRLEGSGGWRGTVIISGPTKRRVLRIERDDRLYPARFVEAASAGH